ncbi:MAG: hypothetical protein DMG76_10700 [Acidobacteria bacterium]|nr:MAG: hypothetical protein DMG76_10700 [Acidobacteriota bacterium]
MTDLAKQFRTARVKAGLAKDLVLYCSRHDYGTRVLNNTGNLAARDEDHGPQGCENCDSLPRGVSDQG